MTPEAIVTGEIRISGLTPDQIRRIEGELSAEVKVRVRGRVVGSETVTIAVRDGPELVVPRGAVDVVRSAVPGVRWVSRVVGIPEVGASGSAHLGIELRPYQRAAVGALVSGVQALVELPCGGGKTTIGAAAIVTLGVPALVVAPTRDIVEQWRETLDRAGAVRVRRPGERAMPGEVVVATPEAVIAAGESWRRGFGVLVVDECHRTPSATLSEIVRSCPARWRWGLTATISRADGLEWTLEHVFGRRVVPATVDELVAAGWLLRPVVYGVATGWAPDPDHRQPVVTCGRCGATSEPGWRSLRAGWARCAVPTCRELLGEADVSDRAPIEWAPMLGELGESPQRTAVVRDLAAGAAARGRTVLVLVHEVELARALAETLRGAGVRAVSAVGADGKRARRAAIEAVRERTADVLVATKLADEGLDVPTIDLVIQAEPGRARGRLIQRAGRALRPAAKGDPIVLVLVDDGPEFSAQWGEARRVYADVFGSSAIGSRAPITVEDAIAKLGPG